MRPLQLQNRMSRKNATKSGMYGLARRRRRCRRRSRSGTRRTTRRRSGARPGMSFEPRTIRIDADEHDRHDDPHRQDRGADARVEDDQLVGRRRRRARSGAQTTCGAGNSSVPLMKQTGKAQASPGVAVLGERRDEDQRDDVEDDDRADEQEPARRQPAPATSAAVLGPRRPRGSRPARSTRLLHTQERGSTPRSDPPWPVVGRTG